MITENIVAASYFTLCHACQINIEVNSFEK